MRTRRLGIAVSAAVLAVSAATATLASGAPGGPANLGANLGATLETDMQAIAGDATQGRNNNTAGSQLTQQYLIGELKQFARGLDSSRPGDDAFKQAIPNGTNIVAVIPGRDLANEFVVVGAHYDHLGFGCRSAVAGDLVCNGATDNAAGVANVLAIGRQIARAPHAPRRSVILALWDREEDGLLGSLFYVQNPLRPLAQTVAYVNYDIQGANLLPSLARDTFAVGAESGGDGLRGLVERNGKQGPLDVHLVSSIFGQGRSDYVNFIGVSVPTVFFSDSTGPCYHTAQDENAIVDFWKLRFQAKLGLDVVQSLANGARIPFAPSTTVATFDDAVELQEVANRAIVDIARFSPAQQTNLLAFRDDLNAIVAEGPANFDVTDVGTILGGAINAVELLASGPCDGFLKGHR